MKRLTYNRLAGAGIRANRRSYLSLSAGIFASIFLVCSIVLLFFTAYEGYLDRVGRDNGKQNAIAFDLTDSEIQKILPLAEQSGICTIYGSCGDYGVGCYDKGAAALAYRQMYDGRMPENSGEIAIELVALDKVAPDARIGDEINLIVTPMDGQPEQRSFILTGIVTVQEQLNKEFLQGMTDEPRAYAPQLMVCADEPLFATGNPVRNLLLSFGDNVTLQSVAAALGDNAGVVGFTRSGYAYMPWENGVAYDTMNGFFEVTAGAFYLAALGLSLLVFTLIGIASSLDSQLERKKEEIGMLRAVGATQRQIFRIFGRESLLLALCLSPLAVGAAIGFVYWLCRIAPRAFCFWLPPLAVVLMLGLSLLSILTASFIPLWRCARQRPMGVLRDTQSLRRAKKLRSRVQFHPTVLVQLRKLRLHPLRYCTGAILTVLLCLSAFLGVQLGVQAVELLARERPMYDFRVIPVCWTGFGDFRTPVSQNRLSDADLDQIRSLPHVKNTVTTWETGAVLDMTEPGQYLQDCLDYDVMMRPVRADGEDYQQAEAMLHPQGTMYYIDILVTDDPERYAEFLTEGQIHRELLDAGQEVLFCAPDYYLRRNGSQYSSSVGIPYDGIFDLKLTNDCIHVGQTLNLAQMVDDPENHTDIHDSQYAELHKGSAQVGGILCALEKTRNGYSYTAPMIVTTPMGLAAMGLERSEIHAMEIYLDSNTDEDAEVYLTDRITRIANRGQDLTVVNQLQITREDRTAGRSILLICVSVLTLFLWITVSIITGSVVRQMQAEKKTIGTLRALGMDGRRLIAAYSGQAVVTVLLGMLIAIPIGFLIDAYKFLFLGTLSLALIAGLSLLLCRWRIGRIGKRLLRESVIDNIREV